MTQISQRIRAKINRADIAKTLNDRDVARAYKKTLASLCIARKPSTKAAVVLHLYYADTLDYFLEKLTNLDSLGFDLFVSVPKSNEHVEVQIKKQYPNAYIFESPNQGRDILPFLMICDKLITNGYQYLLKIHSKKSMHRTDGSEWLDEMVDSLIPKSNSVLRKVVNTLDEESTALIGPKNQYLQLTVNFDANGVHMTNVIKRLYSKNVANNILQTERAKHGFFAGSMFWVRLDAIEKIVQNFAKPNYFELEAGQIDGTFAHAIERLISVIPQIDSKLLYEVDGESVALIDYVTDNIPEWSSVYIGPKAN